MAKTLWPKGTQFCLEQYDRLGDDFVQVIWSVMSPQGEEVRIVAGKSDRMKNFRVLVNAPANAAQKQFIIRESSRVVAALAKKKFPVKVF